MIGRKQYCGVNKSIKGCCISTSESSEGFIKMRAYRKKSDAEHLPDDKIPQTGRKGGVNR